MKTLKCLIVDDEPIARKGIAGFILKTSFLETISSVSNADDALKALDAHDIDLMFLDIEMPDKDGVSMLKELKKAPPTIIVTAYPQFAIEGFELNVVDYLLKPVPYDRFLRAVNKVRNLEGQVALNSNNELYIKTGRGYEKVNIADITFIEARGNYAVVNTVEKKIVSYLSIKKAEELLPKNLFLKVHKSYIVNFEKVSRIEASNLLINNMAIPISRNLKENVLEVLLKNKKFN